MRQPRKVKIKQERTHRGENMLVKLDFTQYNHRLFALRAMLSQLGARHNDSIINDICSDLGALYEQTSSLDLTHGVESDAVASTAIQIKRLSLNADITAIRGNLVDISPICKELSRFSTEISADLKNALEQT